MTTQKKIDALRKAMNEQGLDGYLVPRADEYQGEFVAPYAERLKWLSAFSGSGGCALILAKKAFVLTDGRYTLQARQQTDNKIFETGDYIKKPIGEWIAEFAGSGAVIGYDPKLFTPAQIDKIAEKSGASLKPVKENLIDAMWQDQPERPNAPVSAFPDKVAGITSQQKCNKISEGIAQQGGCAALITLPDSISWLLNIRGSDIEYIPSVQSTVLIDTQGRVKLFIAPEKVSITLGEHIEICDPENLATQIMALIQDSDRPILIDERYTPIYYKSLIESRGGATKNAPDPTIKPKSIKTPSEQDVIRKAHIADGVALVKFMKWLEGEAQKKNQTEISVSEKLLSFRKEHPAFKGDSFPTIAGFGPNGAIIHYRASEKTDTAIEGGNMLLVDSGGQYCEDDIVGTTDITRTIAIGTPTAAMRENFTRVLKGHIALASAQFPKGTVGAQVDILARKALWDAGLDYAHGTGHGVGCYLQVHEDAANISSRGQTPFEPGMLISNEPGYYEEGVYGIRTENLVFVIEKGGDMLGFETVSFAPIDTALIDADMLSKEEKDWLNAYHKDVFEKLSPALDKDTQDWLKQKTAPV